MFVRQRLNLAGYGSSRLYVCSNIMCWQLPLIVRSQSRFSDHLLEGNIKFVLRLRIGDCVDSEAIAFTAISIFFSITVYLL